MTTTSRVVLVSAVLALVAVAPASAAHHAPKRPDLVISAVDLTLTDGHLSGTVTVRNRGQAPALRSTTAIVASEQATQRLHTIRLRPGRHARLPVSETLPAGTTTVVVCADATRRVRESKEHNNCRPASLTGAPASPGTPGSPGSPSASASPSLPTNPPICTPCAAGTPAA